MFKVNDKPERPSSSVSVVNFKQANAGWEILHEKQHWKCYLRVKN